MKKRVLFLIFVIGLLCVGCTKENKSKDKKTEITKSEEKVEDNSENNDINLGDNEKKILNGEVITFESDTNSGEVELAQLDLDLDGSSEKISISYKDTTSDGIFDFDILVNDNKIEIYDSFLLNGIMAFTFDKKSILLATSPDVANVDSYTRLYKYNNGKLEEVGGFEGNIGLLGKKNESISLEGGKLTSNSHTGILRVYAKTTYSWDGSKLTMNPGPYDVVICAEEDEDTFVDEDVLLIEDIKGFKDYKIKDTNINFKSQKYKLLKIVSQQEGEDYRTYLYIKGEDGTEGWIDILEFSDESKFKDFGLVG